MLFVFSKYAGRVFISFALTSSLTHLSKKSTSSNFAHAKKGTFFKLSVIAEVGQLGHLLSQTTLITISDVTAQDQFSVVLVDKSIVFCLLKIVL